MTTRMGVSFPHSVWIDIGAIPAAGFAQGRFACDRGKGGGVKVSVDGPKNIQSMPQQERSEPCEGTPLSLSAAHFHGFCLLILALAGNPVWR